MLQTHHLKRETAIQSHQITDNDEYKGIIDDCEDIEFFRYRCQINTFKTVLVPKRCLNRYLYI